MTGKRLALLVAADQFADPRLSALQAPQADINALAELLSDTEIGGFTVERLVNGTSQELRLALNRLFSRRDPEDFCLLHVSSHGLKDASGELYLAATDTQREYLEATSVDASYLRRQMDHSRAGAVVVLLDCCYGGAFERGMVPRGDGDVDLSGTLVPVTEGRGRAVITASTAIEYAFEGTELRPGAKPEPSIFTEAVVAGIRQGPADVDSNNVLTLSELFTFVSRRVRKRSAHQTPQWWLYGMSGDLVIARNPNPIVTPKDLPDDVVEVLRLPQPAARLGAVFALRALVSEGDPGSALTAYRTLETLAVDDSRQVSTAAAEVLAGIHTTVMVRHGSGGSAALPAAAGQQTIDFGSVAVGQAVPPALIELAGTLAQAGKLEVRDAPVELTRRGLRAEVRLDTSRAATVDDQIEVVGPGGGAVVRVLARIGADVGAESRAAGIGLEAPATTGAEVAPEVRPETEAELAVETGSKTEADVAAETAPAAEAEISVHAPREVGTSAGDESAGAGARTSSRGRRGRLLIAGMVAVALVVIGVVVWLLARNASQTPTAGGQSSTTTEFSAVAPWRLVIANNIQQNDPGCFVTLLNEKSEELWKNSRPIWAGSKPNTFQMHDSGTFRWTVNNSGCLVVHRSGSPPVKLPMIVRGGQGDSAAFEAPQSVNVQVKHLEGGSCELNLHDLATGLAVDIGTATNDGDSTLLETHGSQVYLADLLCDVSVSAG
jgi:hypothetical protein